MKFKNILTIWILASFGLFPTVAFGLTEDITFVTPTPGSTLEGQVGQDLVISITYKSSAADEDYLNLSWTNPDSPLLDEILLVSEKVKFTGSSPYSATLTYTFKGEHGRLDSTGTYTFRTWSSAAPYVDFTFSYFVPENGNVPTANITYPTSGSIFLPGQTITITAEASDGDGTIQSVDFLLGNNTSTATGNESYVILGTDTSAPYSTTFIIPGEGEYKLSARAFDDKGNSGRSSIISFFGSTTPVLETLSSITMNTPIDGATLSVTNPIILSCDVQPAALRSLVSVDYFVNGYRVNTGPVSTTGIEGLFAFSWAQPYIGTHSITARAQLNNGTFVETSNAADVTIVGIGSDPVVSLSIPSTHERVVGSDIQFSAQASDSGALIQNLYFYVNGFQQEAVSGAAATSAIPYNFDFRFPSAGPYEFWVIAEFSNGNRAISNIIKMTIGNGVPPTVNLISPINGMQFLPGTNLPIMASAHDPNSLIKEIQFFVNDTLVGTAIRSASDGSFSVNPSGSSTATYTFNFPFAGDYRIFVQAKDESGLLAQSQTVTVKVREEDPTRPRVIMSHPLPVGGGDTVNDVSVGSSMFLNAIATDGDGTIKFVKFFINGQLVGSSVTGFRDTFSLYYKTTTPGNYIIFAEAVDNDGKRSHSVPLQLNVYALEAQLPIVVMLPLSEQDEVVDAGAEINFAAIANGGLVVVGQINFYVNGVLVDSVDTPDESDVYHSSIVLEKPGTYFLNARAIEIDPLGLTTDNWVISDSIAVLVQASSSNRYFVYWVQQDFFGIYPSQSALDQAVVALDAGQKTQAQYVYELMESAAFDNIREALMARYLLAGSWSNREVLFQDVSTLETVGLNQLVTILLPTFQSQFWESKRIPDGFSTNQDFEDFAKLLFNNKYGVSPSDDQLERCVMQLKIFGSELFIQEFIRDIDATPFGSGTISTVLGIPNPPNSRLSDFADSAVLYIDLLRITPSSGEVDSLSQSSLINRIQSILADPRYTGR